MPDRPDTDIPDSQADSQEGAEAVDEAMLDDDPQLGEMRTFEELPELLVVTRADGDRDDDEALALDADEFDPAAVGDADTEEDRELDYRAATQEREDDIDGLGDEDSYDEDAVDAASSIEGVDEAVADADAVSGGEDDVSNFQARNLGDDDLRRMGYAETRQGQTRAKPDE
jgi:hypothetical protein